MSTETQMGVLIAEHYPVQVSADGFQFLVPSSRLIGLVCTGHFRAEDTGTQSDISMSPPASFAVGLVPNSFIAVLMAVEVWWNAGKSGHRITDFLVRPNHRVMDA